MANEPIKMVPLLWEEPTDLPLLAVNKVVSQFDEGAFFVTFGEVAPPILVGSEEEKRQQAEGIDKVTVRSVVRLAFTEAMVEQVLEVLTANLAKYREMRESL